MLVSDIKTGREFRQLYGPVNISSYQRASPLFEVADKYLRLSGTLVASTGRSSLRTKCLASAYCLSCNAVSGTLGKNIFARLAGSSRRERPRRRLSQMSPN